MDGKEFDMKSKSFMEKYWDYKWSGGKLNMIDYMKAKNEARIKKIKDGDNVNEKS